MKVGTVQTTAWSAGFPAPESSEVYRLSQLDSDRAAVQGRRSKATTALASHTTRRFAENRFEVDLCCVLSSLPLALRTRCER